MVVELAVVDASSRPPFVDGHHRVGAFVCVDSDDHHVLIAFLDVEVTRDRSVSTPQWGRCRAPIKPRRPVHIVLPAVRRDLATEGHGVVERASNTIISVALTPPT